MPKKRSPVFLEKVSSLMGIPIWIPKLKKPPPSCLNLIFLRKSRKIRRNFKFLRHYNYEFDEEYEFSASSTPLIGYSAKQIIQQRKRKMENRDMCSMLFIFTCLGIGRRHPPSCSYPIEGLGRFDSDELADAMMLNGKEGEEVEVISDSGGEEGFSSTSVDERAEEFIKKFYEQMRMQKLEFS